MMRWIGFFIAMALGAAGGLLYGWVINPVQYVDTTTESLRVDYKSDYVLMVAEVYGSENSLPNAIRRLTLMGNDPPMEYVQAAITFAEQHGYADADLITMHNLENALKTWNPILGTLIP